MSQTALPLPAVHQLETPCANVLSEGPLVKARGTLTTPVSEWVSGGLCGSESSAGQPTTRATD